MDGGGVVGASGGGHTHTQIYTKIIKKKNTTAATNELKQQTDAPTTQTDVNVYSSAPFSSFIAVSDVFCGLELMMLTSPDEFWENITVKCTVFSSM